MFDQTLLSALPRSALIPLLLLLPSITLAQGTAYNQTTWGAVLMSFHGEREPLISVGSPALTPLGAQQAFEAGSVIRTRYLSGPDTNITRNFPINGLATNIIDNTQLFLLAADDDYVAASAQAFMQGVYPPIGSIANDQEFVLANGTNVGFPLNGYQYPTIDTISNLDFNFVWIAGNVQCPQFDLSTYQYFDTEEYANTSASYDTFYQELTPIIFQSVVPSSQVTYENAYDLWDYASYQYNHNATVHDTLSPVYLDELYTLASQSQFAMNGNLSASGLVHGDEIRAISGRTFASKTLTLLQEIIGSDGEAPKLSVMFGGFHPFLAFFSLSGLADSGIETFRSIPLNGSVMAFELFSNGSEATAFPDVSELWVRFLYRNGVDQDEALTAYPLFHRGYSETEMLWTDFVAGMEAIGLDTIGQWCTTCASLSMFCDAFTANNDGSSGNSNNNSPSSSHKSLSAPVAGVIGAVVTIAILLFSLGALILLCGFRIHRRDSNRHSGASSLGGFKGAEKLASDTDLTIAKGAGTAGIIRHERVGSWELGPAGGKGADEEGAVGSRNGDNHQSLDRVVSMADYSNKRDDDEIAGVNPFGDPVKIDDRI